MTRVHFYHLADEKPTLGAFLSPSVYREWLAHMWHAALKIDPVRENWRTEET